MFGNHFYHETIKRSVSVFGTLFNNINIKRDDGTFIKVPLAYGQRQKFIARLQQQAGLGLDGVPRTAISLPRMAFELVSIDYDPTRKLNKKVHFKKEKSTDPTVMMKQFSPAPYNLGFDLHALVKNTDDGLQIIEQIMPFFTPDYTVTINTVPSIGDKRDIPIILNSISYEDSYRGDFNERRAIIYTLTFTAKFYLYGPVVSSKVIKQVQVDQYADMPVQAPTREQRYTVTPNPTTADADDDFGFNETVSFFEDAKNFNPATGEDEPK